MEVDHSISSAGHLVSNDLSRPYCDNNVACAAEDRLMARCQIFNNEHGSLQAGAILIDQKFRECSHFGNCIPLAVGRAVDNPGKTAIIHDVRAKYCLLCCDQFTPCCCPAERNLANIAK